MSKSEGNESSFSDIFFIDVMSGIEIKEEPVCKMIKEKFAEIVEERNEETLESFAEIEEPNASLKHCDNNLNCITMKNDKLNLHPPRPITHYGNQSMKIEMEISDVKIENIETPEEKYHQAKLQPNNTDVKIDKTEIDDNSIDSNQDGIKNILTGLKGRFEINGASEKSFNNRMRENLKLKTDEGDKIGRNYSLGKNESARAISSHCVDIGYFRNHPFIHSDKKVFNCSECSYECDHKGSFKRHLLTHSNTKLFKCSECNYECHHKGNLNVHLLTHMKTKLLKCSECSYECNHKGSLKLHLLTHTNTKLFKCSECSYESNHKGNLNLHLRTHLNTKLFKCSECDYECNQKGHLKLHLLTHSDTKLFKCLECDYECIQKSSLKRHLLTHSDAKLFKCSTCSFECNQKRQLNRHLMKHSKPD